jgi:hypothetical protein
MPCSYRGAVAQETIQHAREFLEWRRRTRIDARKLSVYKRVLADECERNHWFIKRLKDLASTGKEMSVPYKVITETSGRQSWGFYQKDDGSLLSGGTLPKVRVDTFERLAVEVTYVHQGLAQKVRAALDSVLELQHLRDGVLDYQHDQPGHMSASVLQEGFFGYALDEVEEHLRTLSVLYHACTGKDLQEHRLR